MYIESVLHLTFYSTEPGELFGTLQQPIPYLQS
jgi:hypothetical protein